MNVLVFDIETIPDIDGARRLHDLHGLSDEDVARAVFHLRRQQANTEFLRHHLHRIVAISVVLCTADKFRVWTLGDPDSPEAELLLDVMKLRVLMKQLHVEQVEYDGHNLVFAFPASTKVAPEQILALLEDSKKYRFSPDYRLTVRVGRIPRLEVLAAAKKAQLATYDH